MIAGIYQLQDDQKSTDHLLKNLFHEEAAKLVADGIITAEQSQRFSEDPIYAAVQIRTIQKLGKPVTAVAFDAVIRIVELLEKGNLEAPPVSGSHGAEPVVTKLIEKTENKKEVG